VLLAADFRVGMGTEAGAQLALLDGFAVAYRGTPGSLPFRAQRVLAFLAFQDRPVLRVYVAGRLWPDVTESRAAGSLRSALWCLGRLEFCVVVATPRTLQLAPNVAVDAREASAWAKRILHGSTGFDEADLDGARYPGELLPDWYDDWVVLEREQLRELRLHALETLGDRLMSHERYGEAVEAALTVLRLEPLRDSAHRLLIRIHLAEGNHAEALRQYNGYRRRLLETLSLVPSHEMDELVRDVTAG